MNIKHFDEALINKDFIALYAYPDDDDVCKIPKNCNSRYLGPLPNDQLDLKFDDEAHKGRDNILLPALNSKGAKFMRKAVNQISKERNIDDVYRNEDALNSMDYCAEHYPYLTSRMVGFYNTDTEEGLIAQDESKHLDFDDANLASIDLDDNPWDVGSDQYTKYLHEDVKDSPHDVEYVINYNLKPIMINTDYPDLPILVGYEVTNDRNGMVIVCANNEANRAKVVKLLTKRAPEYLKSFYDNLKKSFTECD